MTVITAQETKDNEGEKRDHQGNKMLLPNRIKMTNMLSQVSKIDTSGRCFLRFIKANTKVGKLFWLSPSSYALTTDATGALTVSNTGASDQVPA